MNPKSLLLTNKIDHALQGEKYIRYITAELSAIFFAPLFSGRCQDISYREPFFHKNPSQRRKLRPFVQPINVVGLLALLRCRKSEIRPNSSTVCAWGGIYFILSDGYEFFIKNFFEKVHRVRNNHGLGFEHALISPIFHF